MYRMNLTTCAGNICMDIVWTFSLSETCSQNTCDKFLDIINILVTNTTGYYGE